MRFLLLIAAIFMMATSFGQLHPHNHQLPDGGTSTICKHSNKKPSTIETWDSANRFGKLLILSAKGDTLATYHLRKVGGHASVQLSYYPNGQVKQAHYSNAPDGGIQFYRSTTKWSEDGKQTEYWNQEYPDRPLVAPATRPKSDN